jgi:hypothetical protein
MVVVEDDTGTCAVGVVSAAMPAFCRPDTLPIRNRGTLVCIFCSRFLTRARISDTI